MNKKVEETISDVVYDSAQGLLSVIPTVGPLIGYIFGMIAGSPADQRKQNWMLDIAKRLEEVETKQRGFVDKLRTDDQFLDILYQASNIALRNSKEEKLSALRNAVINSAISRLEYSKEQIFLNCIDTLTPMHLKLLRWANGPQKWLDEHYITIPQYMTASLNQVIKDSIPELSTDNSLIDIAWSDLNRMGFLNTNGTRTTMSSGGTLAQRTTDFGKEFLQFISK